MKMKPVNDKIVVKPNKKNEEEKTAGGIILPDTVQDGMLLEGEVIAAGHGMYSANGTLIPIVVEVGDTILYNKHAQTQEYNLNGEDD
jgi:chaperonin GroES